MAYRYCIGYIPKNKLEEVMKEVNRLESLIGTTDEDGNTICTYAIYSYLWNQATQIYCLGSLYSLGENVIQEIGKFFLDKKLQLLIVDKKVRLGTSTMAKLSKCEPVSLEVLAKICCALNCKIEDVVEFIYERN